MLFHAIEQKDSRGALMKRKELALALARQEMEEVTDFSQDV